MRSPETSRVISCSWSATAERRGHITVASIGRAILSSDVRVVAGLLVYLMSSAALTRRKRSSVANARLRTSSVDTDMLNTPSHEFTGIPMVPKRTFADPVSPDTLRELRFSLPTVVRSQVDNCCERGALTREGADGCPWSEKSLGHVPATGRVVSAGQRVRRGTARLRLVAQGCLRTAPTRYCRERRAAPARCRNRDHDQLLSVNRSGTVAVDRWHITTFASAPYGRTPRV